MKSRKILSLLLSLLLLVFSGCGQQEAPATEPTQETEQETVQTPTEETADVDLAAEYKYRDVICDLSLTEGSFACYFFRSNYLRPKPTGVTTSGDATLLIAPDGTTMLIDTNLTPVTARVVDYLQRMGIDKLDYLMLSHSDVDHYGGYEALFAYIEVGHLLISDSPDWFNTSNKAGRCVAKAIELGVPYTILKAGDTLNFGGATMDTLWPVEDYVWSTSDGTSAAMINGGSLVVKFTYKDSSFLFGGDLYVAQEDKVIDLYGEKVQADVVKMNHHGLKTSNSERWIDATAPKLICGMVSTIKEEEVLLRYMFREIPFTYSILDGTCVVYTTGDGVYEVQVEKERDNHYFGNLNTVDGHFQVK